MKIRERLKDDWEEILLVSRRGEMVEVVMARWKMESIAWYSQKSHQAESHFPFHSVNLSLISRLEKCRLVW